MMAVAIPALIALPLLGGCSVSGGVNGSVGGGAETGAHFGLNVDLGISDGGARVDEKHRYEGQTVYVVPNRRVSP